MDRYTHFVIVFQCGFAADAVMRWHASMDVASLVRGCFKRFRWIEFQGRGLCMGSFAPGTLGFKLACLPQQGGRDTSTSSDDKRPRVSMRPKAHA